MPLQVRSSLFAAGCFCEVSDDFALVVLGMLNDMVKFPGLMPKTRLAAVRVFAKMGCSHAIASRAFKVLCLFLILYASYAQKGFLYSMLSRISCKEQRNLISLLLPSCDFKL